MQSNPLLNSQPKRRGRFIRFLSLVILIGAAVAVVLNQRLILDGASYLQYQPTPVEAQLADNSGLSGYGKFLLYATHPKVLERGDFNERCTKQEVGTAILGCYVGNRTYVFDVTDERLRGIKEVTMAHEMLHAGYERLGVSEKSKINSLLDAEYSKLKADAKFRSRMAFYERTEPGERHNELHSIVGTEIRDISTELERHYAKYFDNRQHIVSLSEHYEGTFRDLAQKADALKQRLDETGVKIDSAKQKYATETGQLNADIQSFNARANDGKFASQSQFNSERSALMSRVDQLNIDRQYINGLVEEYNKLVAQYNDVAVQSNDLYKSVDSGSLPEAPMI